ncbi:MAG: TRAP transporter small permease [Synergistetes bacterium]|nr:TRAP transporter small permease [Synergistota bacterium]MDW8193175.1 TRAP transporter small permease [Synergistota bacterium]
MFWSYVLRFNEVLKKFIGYLVIFLFAAVVATINIQIIFRYLLRSPLPWTMEVAQLFFIYFAIFAGGLALTYNAFTKVEFLVNSFPERLRKALYIIVNALIAAFLIIAGQQTGELIYHARITNNITPALSVPMSIVYGIFQIGLWISAFFALTNILKVFVREGPNGVH